jgi:hypothetical protein
MHQPFHPHAATLTTIVALSLAAVFAAAAEPPTVPTVSGDAVIRRLAGGSEIVITTTSRLAGAIHSLTWGGREFIDSYDHGRQLQSASNLDVEGKLFNECFNPTEAGCERDMAGPTSTSRLLHLTAGGRELVTVTQMAFWLRPGQTSGGHPALNTTALSNHLLQKHVRIGVAELDHAIRHAISFTLPADERHERATFEILTGYMPPAFETFLRLLPDGSLEEIGPGPGEQPHPVILATADGRHAMGCWSPAVSRTTGKPATYGRFAFPAQKVVKWNCVVREENPRGLAAGQHPFVVYSAVGTKEQVRDTLVTLRQRGGAEAAAAGKGEDGR